MMLTFIIIHGEIWHVFKWIGMIFPSFTHLHEANVRTEVRPSIYPCNYKSFLPLFSLLFFFPLLPLLFFLFLSFSLPFPFSLFSSLWLICEEGSRVLKYVSRIQIWFSKRVQHFSLTKSISFYFLTLLFSVLNEILTPEKFLHSNTAVPKIRWSACNYNW